MTPSAPAARVMLTVERTMTEVVSELVWVKAHPQLNPYHRNQRVKEPSICNAAEWPGKCTGSSNNILLWLPLKCPYLCPSSQTPIKAVNPRVMCTTPLPEIRRQTMSPCGKPYPQRVWKELRVSRANHETLHFIQPRQGVVGKWFPVLLKLSLPTTSILVGAELLRVCSKKNRDSERVKVVVIDDLKEFFMQIE